MPHKLAAPEVVAQAGVAYGSVAQAGRTRSQMRQHCARRPRVRPARARRSHTRRLRARRLRAEGRGLRCVGGPPFANASQRVGLRRCRDGRAWQPTHASYVSVALVYRIAEHGTTGSRSCDGSSRRSGGFSSAAVKPARAARRPRTGIRATVDTRVQQSHCQHHATRCQQNEETPAHPHIMHGSRQGTRQVTALGSSAALRLVERAAEQRADPLCLERQHHRHPVQPLFAAATDHPGAGGRRSGDGIGALRRPAAADANP